MLTNLSSADTSGRSSRRVRVPKIAELVAARLRREIVFGELREGDPLASESELMVDFGVSRPTLREAFRILESEGLISVVRGTKGGTRVHSPSPEVAARYTGWLLQHQQSTLSDVYAARVTLEAKCARLLAASRTQEGLEALRTALDHSEAELKRLEEREPRPLAHAQQQFHRLVVDLAGNRALSLLASMMDVILDRADMQYVEISQSNRGIQDLWQREQRAHAKLVELIEMRDVEQAGRLWEDHLDASAEQVLRSLGSKSVIEFME